MSDSIQRARALLEAGTSVRETARESGLTKGQVEKLRAELAGERRIQGLDPLPGARVGRPGLVDLEVKVSRALADDLDARARAAGLDRGAYILHTLWPDAAPTD